MAKRTKIAAPQLPVPQSDVEAAAAIARIGELMREDDRVKAAGDDRIAEIAAEIAASRAPLKAKIKAETDGLRTYLDANRGRLTDGCKVKHVKFETGEAGWRYRPAAVRHPGLKEEEVILRIKALKLVQFIRTREELDKDAMKKEAELAKSVAGVVIASSGEDFYVEPLQMAEAAT